MLSISRRSGAPFMLIALFEVFGFAILSIREGALGLAEHLIDPMGIILMAGALFLLILQYWLLPALFRYIDRYVMILYNTLFAVGIVIQYRLNAQIAVKQMLFFTIGLVAMAVIIGIFQSGWLHEGRRWLYFSAGLLLLGVAMVFGTVTRGARNWIEIGSFTLQPSEFAKVALVFVLACYLREKRRFWGYTPLFAFVGISVILLVLQKDLGAALLFYMTFLLLLYVATSNWGYLGAGLGALAVGGVISYKLFDHVRLRVAVWQNPWSMVDDGGYQIVQGLMALVSGGVFGSGLGLGSPKYIPAYRTDYIFAVISEEFGILFGVLLIGLYVLLVFRGAAIARRANNAFHALLALGVTVMIALQSFIIIGGVIKLIPLTGVTLPLVSYGGSSMLSTMMLMGILLAVSQENGRADAETLDEAYDEEEWDEEDGDDNYQEDDV